MLSTPEYPREVWDYKKLNFNSKFFGTYHLNDCQRDQQPSYRMLYTHPVWYFGRISMLTNRKCDFWTYFSAELIYQDCHVFLAIEPAATLGALPSAMAIPNVWFFWQISGTVCMVALWVICAILQYQQIVPIISTTQLLIILSLSLFSRFLDSFRCPIIGFWSFLSINLKFFLSFNLKNNLNRDLPSGRGGAKLAARKNKNGKKNQKSNGKNRKKLKYREKNIKNFKKSQKIRKN